jgi:poly-beta-hydroxybutyrate-responsive repressor
MSELVACPCNGGTLDRLIQPAILVVLADGPLHGYRLVKRISELPGFTGQKPDASGVYRLLKAMERKGLVASSWDISECGPAKRSYQITSAGDQCLCRWIRTLESYRRGISGLLGAARKAAHHQTKKEVCCDG